MIVYYVLCVTQVKQLQEDATRLQSAYAGDKAEDIQRREAEVLEAWRSLLEACDGRRLRLIDTNDKFRFFSMVRDLMLWMEDVIRLIDAQEKPRYIEWLDTFMYLFLSLFAYRRLQQLVCTIEY